MAHSITIQILFARIPRGDKRCLLVDYQISLFRGGRRGLMSWCTILAMVL